MSEGPVVIKPVGRLDGGTSNSFEADVTGRIKTGCRRLLLDISEIVFVSSAGLRAILAVSKYSTERGGRLAVCCPSPQVREVFDLTGFSSLINLYPSYELAHASLLTV